jgi:hypothetical protein
MASSAGGGNNMNQRGDQVSQSSMHRGQESDIYASDSNKLNIQELMKQRQNLPVGINSDRTIHFVNNLPI